MVIGKMIFSNVGFGDDGGFRRVPLSLRSCISCLR